MTKNDLKDGMTLQTRDGKRYLLANGIMRDFDGYTILANYTDDLKNKYYEDFDIVKVYKDSGMYSLTNVLKDGYLTLIWESEEIKLTDREVEILKALKILGYEWLARDKNDKLFAYEKTPVKDTFIWFCKEEHYYYPVKEKELFNFIKWEDEESTKIDDLLKETNK